MMYLECTPKVIQQVKQQERHEGVNLGRANATKRAVYPRVKHPDQSYHLMITTGECSMVELRSDEEVGRDYIEFDLNGKINIMLMLC